MKKIILSLSLIFGFTVYAGYRHGSESFIKNSEVASSQTAEPTTPVKIDALPNATAVEDFKKKVPKSQTAVRADDENYDYENEEGGDDEEAANAKKVQTASLRTSPPQTTSTEKSSAQLAPMPMIKKQYKNGEYAGSIADAYYGNVQVKAIISGGKIIDVQFLDYPNDRQNSIRINTYAMPILKSEVIRAQNAKVDVVSGATATSEAFQESLASALAQAKN